MKYVWINMELSDDVHIIMFRPEIRCEKRKYLSRELPASLLARWAPKTFVLCHVQIGLLFVFHP